MASDVDIAENARFKFQIIQPALNNVTYADNASQLTPHGGHHAPVQNAGLLAQHPADNEKRFDQRHQVGEVLDELFNARGFSPVEGTSSLKLP